MGSLLRRALLYVPASSPRMLQKASTLSVDCLTYDLEDSVTVSQKPTAREHLRHQLALPRPGGVKELAVRINSDSVDADMAAIAVASIDAVVCPKVNSASDLTYISDLLEHYRNPAKIIALIESARGVMDIRTICSSTPRLSGLIFAAEDFAADLGVARTEGLKEFLFARQTIVAAAQAYGLEGGAMDLVCTDYKDLAKLERECRDGVAMGFRGKQVIHPSQVEVVQRGFSPREEEVKKALRVLKAAERAEELGKGSWALEGKMVDRPVIEAAKKLRVKAEAAGLEVERLWDEVGDVKPE